MLAHVYIVIGFQNGPEYLIQFPRCTMEISTSFPHVNDFIPFPPWHFLSNILICLLMYVTWQASKHKYVKREEKTGVTVSGNGCHCF